MNKIEILLSELKNENEYIRKADIYDELIEFIDHKNSLNLVLNGLLNELMFINFDKLKYFLADNDHFKYHLLEKSLSDNELIVLLKELIKYEKRYLH